MSENSYVAWPRDLARSKAEKVIERVRAYRARRAQEYLTERAKEINDRWYRRLFKMKPVTPEDVRKEEERLNADADFLYYGIPTELFFIQNHLAGNQKRIAQRILKALENPEVSQISLSLEDVNDLG